MKVPLEQKRFVLLIAGLFAVCFWDVLIGVRSFYFRDFSHFGYPIAAHLKQRFWAGELPLWNPYNNCGLPFLAQWNTMVLYPGSLFIALFPVPWAVNFFCLAHLVLGGFGMRHLMRKWTDDPAAADAAGVLFSFNGLALNCLMWPNNSAAWGWMPWVVGSLSGRQNGNGGAISKAAVISTLQMLTGAPEVIVFTWVIAAALAPLRQWIFLAVVGLLAFCLSSPQLLPFLELLGQSHRAAGDFGAGEWAMPLSGLMNFVAPSFGSETTPHGPILLEGQKWTSSYYVGIVALGLALAGLQRNWKLAVLLAASLALATGAVGLGFFRYPIKLVVVAVFCLVALAGLGIAKLQIGRRSWSWVLPVILALDVAIRMPWQNPTVPSGLLAPKSSRAANEAFSRSFLTLEAYDELRSRMLTNAAADLAIRREALLQNLNLIDAVPKLDGFFSLYPQREREFRRALYVSELSEVQPALDFLSVSRFSEPGSVTEWTPRTNALPLVTGGQTPIFLREGQILRAMLEPSFDPRRTVYLWNGYSNSLGAERKLSGESAGAVRLASRTAQEIRIQAAGGNPGFAVIAEAYDSNWQAEADGKAARLFRANYNFIAVEMPPGAATATLRYRSRAFENGLGLAAGALGICFFLALRKGKPQAATG